jgi:hypothetical protein
LGGELQLSGLPSVAAENQHKCSDHAA